MSIPFVAPIARAHAYFTQLFADREHWTLKQLYDEFERRGVKGHPHMCKTCLVAQWANLDVPFADYRLTVTGPYGAAVYSERVGADRATVMPLIPLPPVFQEFVDLFDAGFLPEFTVPGAVLRRRTQPGRYSPRPVRLPLYAEWRPPFVQLAGVE